MQTKDIPDIPVLQFLDSLKNGSGTRFDDDGKLSENSVQHGMPPKLAHSTMASLIQRGLIDGCACDWQGEFALADKGKAELAGHCAPAATH